MAKFNQLVLDVALMSARLQLPQVISERKHSTASGKKKGHKIEPKVSLSTDVLANILNNSWILVKNSNKTWVFEFLLFLNLPPPPPTRILIMCIISVIHITTFYIILCLFIFSVELCKTSSEWRPLRVIECRFHVIPTRLLTWRQSVPFKRELHLNVTWVYLNS